MGDERKDDRLAGGRSGGVRRSGGTGRPSGREPTKTARGPATEAVRTQAERGPYREHSVPIYMTSSFVFDSAEQGKSIFAGEEEGLVYSRYGNPNTEELVRKLAAMEETDDGIATSTGMAAMFASMAALLGSGDHVVASRALFGSTFQMLTVILPKWGIEATLVDGTNLDAWRAAIRPNTKLFVAETPSNPGLELIDIESVAGLAHERGIVLVVDNSFASPYLQRPAALGADLVVHSTTKLIDGQGRTLGGAVLGRARLMDEIRFFARQTGPSLSPFNAWIASKGLETLAVRVERHCDNAEALAEFLDGHPSVAWTRYPFLDSHPQVELAKRQMKRGGGMVTFEVKGEEAGAMAFMDRLGMISLSSNLGDSRTIATHPASTTHSKLSEEERRQAGITPGTIRMSVGLEDVEDIVGDVRQALEG